jgi:hypothetical protein
LGAQQDTAFVGEESRDPVVESQETVGIEAGRQEVVRLDREGVFRARDGAAVPAGRRGQPPELPPVSGDQGGQQTSRKESCQQHGPVR